jgi:hypothetical protein
MVGPFFEFGAIRLLRSALMVGFFDLIDIASTSRRFSSNRIEEQNKKSRERHDFVWSFSRADMWGLRSYYLFTDKFASTKYSQETTIFFFFFTTDLIFGFGTGQPPE